MSETSGNFKRLLVSLCVGSRDESGVTDVLSAQRDATELLRAGELQIGTDESTFNMILCQRNYQQLKLVCEEYAKMTGHTLERAIQKEFSGDIKDGLLAILESVNNKHGFFAERLKKSMAGMGTNDAQLIRIIVTRSEVDLMDIKTVFETTFGKSLKSWIKVSGHVFPERFNFNVFPLYVSGRHLWPLQTRTVCPNCRGEVRLSHTKDYTN